MTDEGPAAGRRSAEAWRKTARKGQSLREKSMIPDVRDVWTTLANER